MHGAATADKNERRGTNLVVMLCHCCIQLDVRP